MLTELDRALEAAILGLLAQRAEGKTICPSEAARQVDSVQWSELMDAARAAAQRLVAKGKIVVTQHGEVVNLTETKGPIRLRLT